MVSYHLRLREKTLYVGFNREQSASGDRLVRDAASQIDQLIRQGQLTGGELLKVDGPQSVAIAYVLAQRLTPLYGAIAVLDPKVCRPGYRVYIVAISRNPDYPLGSLIEVPIGGSALLKVAVCGFPQTGKSCLIEGIRQAICGQIGAPYPYVIRACPDGEGAWLHQTQVNNPALAENLRAQNKRDWNATFAETAADWVRSANEVINLIDTGGLPSPENRLIMAEASHAIILYKTVAEREQWLNFCQDLGLPPLAVVESRLGNAPDEVNLSAKDQPITGVVYGLSRGEANLRDKLMIRAIAHRLIDLTSSEK
jgi:CRISPR-associated protein Csx3